jgi:hypothetical protein
MLCCAVPCCAVLVRSALRFSKKLLHCKEAMDAETPNV